MKTAIGYFAAAAAMIGLANPCLAQDHMGFGPQAEQGRGTFAGVNLRMDFGPRERARPVARLALSPTFERHGGDGMWPVRSPAPDKGFELGLSRGGRAELHVAGQPAARIGERLGAKGDLLSPAAIVFGVVLLGVGILVLSSDGDVGTPLSPQPQ